MERPRPRLIVEYRADQQFAQALFGAYRIPIDGGHTHSGAISHAEVSLLEHPEQPVAVLLNAGTEDPIAIKETRGAAMRILARAYPENWCVALAIPRLNAWALTDPRIREAFEADEATRKNYYAQAARIGALTKNRPFDDSVLRRDNADYRGLVEFLERHGAQAPSRAEASGV
jgi:hypothetical protein